MGEQGNVIDPQQPTQSQPIDSVFILGVASLILVLLTWGALFVMSAARTRQAGVYDKKISEQKVALTALKDTEQTYTAVNTVVSQAKKLRDSRYLFGPTWTMLRNSVPKDVQFTSVSMGNDYVFRVTGASKSVNSVAQFAKQLEKQEGVIVVTPLSVEKQATSGFYNFSLSFSVKVQSSVKAGS